METSALNATNVEQAFTLLLTTIYQRKKISSVDTTGESVGFVSGPTKPISLPTESNVEILTYNNNEQKKTGCCKTS